MMLGTVKWFNNSKGYGFIGRDDGAKDVFVHYTGIANAKAGFKSLQEGERVSFELVQSPRGVQANNVNVVSGT